MRPAVLAAVVLAALPAVGPAQTGPYLAVVVDSQAILRAGPTAKFPETGTLPRGTRVVVDHEETNGWLAVTAPGQVSWVATQFIEGFNPEKPTPQYVNVSSEGEVTLAAGRVGLHEPLDIRKVAIPNGTILQVIGPPVKYADRTWFPVEPPVKDFRYLAKAAVQFERAHNTSFVVRDSAPLPQGSTPQPGGATPAGASIPAPAGIIAPPAPVVDHPLWAQAEAAEKNGHPEEAEKLYFQLARLMNEPGGNRDTANLCYTRIHSLRQKKRTAGNSGGTGNPAWQSSGPGERPALLPPTRDPGAIPVSTRPNTPTPPAETRADDGQRWTGPGMLIRSALTPDGRKAYALESSPGVVRAYVVAATGLDLDRFVNRRVDLYGSVSSRRDLSRPFVVATNAELAP